MAALVLGSVGSVLTAPPASADCPNGTVQSHFPGLCTAGQSRDSIPDFISPGDVRTDFQPNQIPSINGVPCNLQHFGTCWGFGQNG